MVCHQKDLIHDFVNIILTSQTPDSEIVDIDNDNDWPLVSQKYPHFSYGNRVTYMHDGTYLHHKSQSLCIGHKCKNTDHMIRIIESALLSCLHYDGIQI